MDALTACIALFLAFFAGCWTTLGVMSVVTERLYFNPRRIQWSSREVRMLGLTMAVQGLILGLWTVVLTLTLSFRTLPWFWLGPSWGIPQLWLPFIALSLTLAFTAWIQLRHFHRWPFRA